MLSVVVYLTWLCMMTRMCCKSDRPTHRCCCCYYSPPMTMVSGERFPLHALLCSAWQVQLILLLFC
jgi:hypothetical protein